MPRNQSIVAHRTWANTPDRAARTANARARSPIGIEWHLARLDPERFANATDEQKRQAAESARTAWLKEQAAKSVAARKAKRERLTSEGVVVDMLNVAVAAADVPVDLETLAAEMAAAESDRTLAQRLAACETDDDLRALRLEVVGGVS